MLCQVDVAAFDAAALSECHRLALVAGNCIVVDAPDLCHSMGLSGDEAIIAVENSLERLRSKKLVHHTWTHHKTRRYICRWNGTCEMPEPEEM